MIAAMDVSGFASTSACRLTAPRSRLRASTTNRRSRWPGRSARAWRSARTLGDGLRLPHGDDLQAHQPSNRVRRIGIGLLKQLSVDFAERPPHIPHDFLRQLVGDPRKSSGSQFDAIFVSRWRSVRFDQPRARWCIELHHDFRRLPRVERGPDRKPILGGQPIEHRGQIGRMQPTHAPAQVDGVLALLKLLGDAALGRVLAVGQRHQRAVVLEQGRDLARTCPEG